MRITDVKPFAIAGNGWNYFFVKVETDEGIYGIGESGLTYQERAVEATVLRLRSALVGEDPFRTEHLWQLMFRGGFFPGGKVLCSAISAIDVALWDIKAKAVNQPLYNLLGGLCRDKVVCYPHNSGTTTEALVESCRQTADEGWKFVRWGQPGADVEIFEPAVSVRTAVERLEAVRGALGDAVELCLDVHTRLDPPDVIRLCREVERYRPFFIEDPLRSEYPQAYRSLVSHVHVPIAAGEQWASKWEFRQLVEEDLIHYARIELGIVGGITEALKIARWCETHYINLAPHNALGPVNAAAGLHLCLASPNVGVLELPTKPGTSLADVFPVQATWEDGYLLPPSLPGLGVEFDEEAARKHSPAKVTAPEAALRRKDGSLTNF